MSRGHPGKRKQPRSPKQIAQLKAVNAMMAGRPQTPEHIEKNRVAHTGKRHSLKTRAKMRASHIGKRNTPEAIEKIRAAKKGKCAGDKNPSWGRTGEKHPMWRGGISREPYGWNFNAELKEEVRRRDGYKCQLCGVPQAECRRKLDVHHGDYDKRNNDPVNLTSLCPSCHSKTNVNREYWMAFFQEKALSRARQGLLF